MSNTTELPEDIRAAKHAVLEEALNAIDELTRDENSPTARRGLKAARTEVYELSKRYWGKAEKAAWNAMYAAAREGGSSRGAAFVSADMKPGKV